MDVQRHLFLRRCFAYICCLLLCFITATTVYAQKVSVKGTVVDTNGDAIIGASVKVLKKSSVGTITGSPAPVSYTHLTLPTIA